MDAVTNKPSSYEPGPFESPHAEVCCLMLWLKDQKSVDELELLIDRIMKRGGASVRMNAERENVAKRRKAKK